MHMDDLSVDIQELVVYIMIFFIESHVLIMKLLNHHGFPVIRLKFCGSHHGLFKHYRLFVSQITTDMFWLPLVTTSSFFSFLYQGAVVM